MKYFFILLLFFKSFSIVGQATIDAQQIVGKWKFTGVEVTGFITIDLEHIDSSRSHFIDAMKPVVYPQGMTEKDSLSAINKFNEFLGMMENVYLEFNSDSLYTGNFNKQIIGERKVKTTGRYFIDSQKQELNIDNDKAPVKILRLDSTTLMIDLDNEKSNKKVIAIFKKVN